MKISLKAKTSTHSFVPFPDSPSSFQHFEKKDDCHSYFITEITGCEGLGLTTLRKTLFQNTL